MKYIKLGKTGLTVSKVGFGGIPIQRIGETECKDLFKTALKSGINYIDTAKAYTVSESYIGASLEGMRDQFVLASKSMARDCKTMAADIDDSLKKLRTDYIDLYQVHNPNLEQLKQVTACGGALEALLAAKKDGKIGHIGVTAHSLETFAAVLEMDWVETIMFPYNIVETQGQDLIHQCHARNIGFIAMKPLAGGAIEDGSLAVRFVLSNPDVSIVIPGMFNTNEIQINVAAGEDNNPLQAAEAAKIEQIRATLTGNFCRRCNYCAPCTVGISIPNVFLFEGYLDRYGLADWARERYATLSVKADACIGCGVCETRCPYNLPIREMLKCASQKFDKKEL